MFDVDAGEPDVAIGSPERQKAGEPFHDVMARRVARRGFLKTAAAASGVAAAGLTLDPRTAAASVASPSSRALAAQDIQTTPASVDSLSFTPIVGSSADAVIVPDGYENTVIIRWGDSLFEGTPDLDTSSLASGGLLRAGAAADARKQFGYNNDAIEFFPLNRAGTTGLICVNHEYTNDDLLFPDYPEFFPDREDVEAYITANPQVVDVMKANHGVSVVKVVKKDGVWRYQKGGRRNRYNRRIHADTPIRINGPARGHEMMQTAASPKGRRVRGTLNNCAAGATPYGTYLTAEENIDQYFGGYDDFLANLADMEASGTPDSEEYRKMRRAAFFHQRLPLPDYSSRGWELVDERFDVSKHPTEALRHGWVTEIDPYSPTARPRKRTALGRFKHECATSIRAKSDHVVVYMGDDARMEYMYKFVSRNKLVRNRQLNLNVLDHGTLYCARLDDDGSGEWLPLVHGQGPLTEENGFESQADVLIGARLAGDLLGATPMDRPEDFEANPVTGRVYCALTNNTRRTVDGAPRDFQGRELSTAADVPNPRSADDGNRFGHVIEITEAGGDHTATTFDWEILLLCGDPLSGDGHYLTSLEDLDDVPLRTNDTYFAGYPVPEDISPLGAPDNVSFDKLGNLWIVTDGSQPLETNNGAFATELEGPNRGRTMQFLSGPTDSEVCACEFTPDGEALFFAIQHPGDGAPLPRPTSEWPDGSGSQPRPSVTVVTKTGGGRIGA